MKIEKTNITKNNVSYFIAGYKSCLVNMGFFTAEEIENLDYTTTDFGNYIKEFLRAYDEEKYDKQGLEIMYKKTEELLKAEDNRISKYIK